MLVLRAASLIKAVRYIPKKIIFCIGGTCTNDAGMGLLISLGVKFYDKNHNELEGIGKSLEEVYEIDYSNLDSRLSTTEIVVANDVTNCLYGNNDAKLNNTSE